MDLTSSGLKWGVSVVFIANATLHVYIYPFYVTVRTCTVHVRTPCVRVQIAYSAGDIHVVTRFTGLSKKVRSEARLKSRTPSTKSIRNHQRNQAEIYGG